MCGIFAYVGSDSQSFEELKTEFDKISYRGPDLSSYESYPNNVFMGFHRLSIMDESELGNQPMSHPDDDSITMICNGEIYNYRELKDKYSISTKSNSDCEIILHLYKILPMKQLLSSLDGVFAFVINDESKGLVTAARDPIGVRPLFVGSKDNSVIFSSELKSLVGLCDDARQFSPGTYWSSALSTTHIRYYNYRYGRLKGQDEKEICENISELLTEAVRKRLMSDREIGCLLSGGLDSSLIASLVQRDLSDHSSGSGDSKDAYAPKKIKTFSIGMEGSPDLKFAGKVARWIGSEHHEVVLEPQDFLDAIPEVIYKIESYDTTTVRASVGNYLVSKYISENTDCKVIFNGDGADEVCAGYVYNKDAPTLKELQAESVRLVKELCYFDVLRSDRSISSNGLEARTPFLDIDFVRYYMSISPEFKAFDKINTIEKRLLRKAFDGKALLPEDVLWRDKCAFSDGVSKSNNSWHTIIQKYVDTIISDEDFETESLKIKHCRPLLKESLYYRNIYRELFGNNDRVIPHFWMPKWTDVIDPSARELTGYKE